MVDMGSISAAVGSLRVAGEMAVGLIKLNTLAEVQAKAIELNQKLIESQHAIFAAHTTQTELVQRIGELEKQIAQMEAWEAQKQRYQMVIPYQGGTVYALKKSMSEGEPAHYICANCYQHGKRSILQCRNPTYKAGDSVAVLFCANPSCKSQVTTAYTNCETAKYAGTLLRNKGLIYPPLSLSTYFRTFLCTSKEKVPAVGQLPTSLN